MKTKSAVLYEYGKPMKIEELELDKPKEKEVLIKYEAAGICHSDLSIMNGVLNAPPLPAILGHEGAGIVHEIGPQVTRVKLGDHVAALLPEGSTLPMRPKGQGQRWNDAGRLPSTSQGGSKDQYDDGNGDLQPIQCVEREKRSSHR
jgi:NADPH:quinone reductase-like Zn-dependent oxidoreductase